MAKRSAFTQQEVERALKAARKVGALEVFVQGSAGAAIRIVLAETPEAKAKTELAKRPRTLI